MDGVAIASDVVASLSFLLGILALYGVRVHYQAQAVVPKPAVAAPRPAAGPAPGRFFATGGSAGTNSVEGGCCAGALDAVVREVAILVTCGWCCGCCGRRAAPRPCRSACGRCGGRDSTRRIAAAGATAPRYHPDVRDLGNGVILSHPGPATAPPPPNLPEVDPLAELAAGWSWLRALAVWGRITFPIGVLLLAAISSLSMAGLGFSTAHRGPIGNNLGPLTASWVFGIATSLVAVHALEVRHRVIASATRALFRPSRTPPLQLSAALGSVKYAVLGLLALMVVAVLSFTFAAAAGIFFGVVGAGLYVVYLATRLGFSTAIIVRVNRRLLTDLQAVIARTSAQHGESMRTLTAIGVGDAAFGGAALALPPPDDPNAVPILAPIPDEHDGSAVLGERVSVGDGVISTTRGGSGSGVGIEEATLATSGGGFGAGGRRQEELGRSGDSYKAGLHGGAWSLPRRSPPLPLRAAPSPSSGGNTLSGGIRRGFASTIHPAPSGDVDGAGEAAIALARGVPISASASLTEESAVLARGGPAVATLVATQLRAVPPFVPRGIATLEADSGASAAASASSRAAALDVHTNGHGGASPPRDLRGPWRGNGLPAAASRGAPSASPPPSLQTEGRVRLPGDVSSAASDADAVVDVTATAVSAAGTPSPARRRSRALSAEPSVWSGVRSHQSSAFGAAISPAAPAGSIALAADTAQHSHTSTTSSRRSLARTDTPPSNETPPLAGTATGSFDVTASARGEDAVPASGAVAPVTTGEAGILRAARAQVAAPAASTMSMRVRHFHAVSAETDLAMSPRPPVSPSPETARAAAAEPSGGSAVAQAPKSVAASSAATAAAAGSGRALLRLQLGDDGAWHLATGMPPMAGPPPMMTLQLAAAHNGRSRLVASKLINGATAAPSVGPSTVVAAAPTAGLGSGAAAAPSVGAGAGASTGAWPRAPTLAPAPVAARHSHADSTTAPRPAAPAHRSDRRGHNHLETAAVVATAPSTVGITLASYSPFEGVEEVRNRRWKTDGNEGAVMAGLAPPYLADAWAAPSLTIVVHEGSRSGEARRIAASPKAARAAALLQSQAKGPSTQPLRPATRGLSSGAASAAVSADSSTLDITAVVMVASSAFERRGSDGHAAAELPGRRLQRSTQPYASAAHDPATARLPVLDAKLAAEAVDPGGHGGSALRMASTSSSQKASQGSAAANTVAVAAGVPIAPAAAPAGTGSAFKSGSPTPVSTAAATVVGVVPLNESAGVGSSAPRPASPLAIGVRYPAAGSAIGPVVDAASPAAAARAGSLTHQHGTRVPRRAASDSALAAARWRSSGGDVPMGTRLARWERPKEAPASPLVVTGAAAATSKSGSSDLRTSSDPQSAARLHLAVPGDKEHPWWLPLARSRTLYERRDAPALPLVVSREELLRMAGSGGGRRADGAAGGSGGMAWASAVTTATLATHSSVLTFATPASKMLPPTPVATSPQPLSVQVATGGDGGDGGGGGSTVSAAIDPGSGSPRRMLHAQAAAPGSGLSSDALYSLPSTNGYGSLTLTSPRQYRVVGQPLVGAGTGATSSTASRLRARVLPQASSEASRLAHHRHALVSFSTHDAFASTFTANGAGAFTSGAGLPMLATHRYQWSQVTAGMDDEELAATRQAMAQRMLVVAVAMATRRTAATERLRLQQSITRFRTAGEQARARLPKLRVQLVGLVASAFGLTVAMLAMVCTLSASMLFGGIVDVDRRSLGFGFRVSMLALNLCIVAVVAPYRERWQRAVLMVQVRRILRDQQARIDAQIRTFAAGGGAAVGVRQR